ncbi:unnamed protein product [Moneuplotes crassus]|uniref:Uncharacterized protein n=1 Tax=Euplotes crassus TaxID=5936 RepID=A0AAD1U7Q3_EUPCR|nr:unnamed protein product [Moneuplotes crassus]
MEPRKLYFQDPHNKENGSPARMFTKQFNEDLDERTPHPEDYRRSDISEHLQSDVEYNTIGSDYEAQIKPEETFELINARQVDKNAYGCISTEDVSLRFKRKKPNQANKENNALRYKSVDHSAFKNSQVKKEISFQKLLARTCSSPDEQIVTTENYFPTEETEEKQKESFTQTFSKEMKMDQFRPAKPEESMHILKEQDLNKILYNSNNSDASLPTLIQKIENENKEPKKELKPCRSSKTIEIMQTSLEEKLKQAQERTKRELEKQERLKNSHKFEIEAMNNELSTIAVQFSFSQRTIDQRIQLENQHFDITQRMRGVWKEQLDQLKQTHLEGKEDIESIITKRESQLKELKEDENDLISTYEKKKDQLKEQIELLSKSIEDMVTDNYSKEENKEEMTTENTRIEENLYKTSERLGKESEYLQGLIEVNMLLHQGLEEIEILYLKKRNKKLNGKKRKQMVTPRLGSLKSPTTRKSSQNVNSFRKFTRSKSGKSRRKPRPQTKVSSSYHTSRELDAGESR